VQTLPSPHERVRGDQREVVVLLLVLLGEPSPPLSPRRRAQAGSQKITLVRRPQHARKRKHTSSSELLGDIPPEGCNAMMEVPRVNAYRRLAATTRRRPRPCPQSRRRSAASARWPSATPRRRPATGRPSSAAPASAASAWSARPSSPRTR